MNRDLIAYLGLFMLLAIVALTAWFSGWNAGYAKGQGNYEALAKGYNNLSFSLYNLSIGQCTVLVNYSVGLVEGSFSHMNWTEYIVNGTGTNPVTHERNIAVEKIVCRPSQSLEGVQKYVYKNASWNPASR